MLVVIGILIAVQIDNWNEGRQDRILEQKILGELLEEYQSNFDQLEEKISMRNQMLEDAHLVLKYIDHPSLLHRDSLLQSLGSLLRDPTFDPIKNDLISSGNLRLIKNDSLRKLLSNWPTEVYQVQDLELQWQKIRTEKGVELYMKSGIARDTHDNLWKNGYTPVEALDQSIKITRKIGNSRQELDLYTAINNLEYEGYVASAMTWLQLANIQSAALKERIKRIISLIEKEMNS